MNKIIQLTEFKNSIEQIHNDLRLVILPGQQVDPKGLEDYVSTYKLWHSVWAQTLKELDGVDHLHSDQFTRQEMIASLFLGKQCVGITCYRKADLSNPVDQQDSWFIPWKPTLMTEIGQKYPSGMVNSFFTVHPDFRKSNTNPKLPIDISILLTEVSSYMANYAGVDVTYGVTRNNRSVNKLAYYAGAIALAKNQQHHGVAVDLIALFPENTSTAMTQFSPQIDLIWKNRTSYVTNPLVGRPQTQEKNNASVA